MTKLVWERKFECENLNVFEMSLPLYWVDSSLLSPFQTMPRILKQFVDIINH